MSELPEHQLYYRELTPLDKPYMQGLCLECFPIDYPDSWFDDLLRDDGWNYTQGAFELGTGRMVGMIVGQVQTLDHLEGEYGYVLEEATPRSELTMYITIFGVSESYRRKGVGSTLMQSLANYSITQTSCKVIYLHVEAVNTTAITFYERRGFTYHCTDRGYYNMPGEAPSDGFIYLQYIKNARPYKPSLENWCRRNIWSNPIGQCLVGVVKGPWNSIRHVWQRSISSPS